MMTLKLWCCKQWAQTTHIYVEQNVSTNSNYVSEPKGIELNAADDNGGDNNSEDEAWGVRFDDIEDERTIGLNDGFGVFEVEKPAYGTNRVEIRRQSYKLKTVANKSSGKK